MDKSVETRTREGGRTGRRRTEGVRIPKAPAAAAAAASAEVRAPKHLKKEEEETIDEIQPKSD